ncbi:15254_t:CDS:2 [Acaulospora morrowiae]|uniref:15254_t:CDS:1 n=1 Tax=Acaulospora morrowiae TaxID=94023 RepID=A0A9N9A5S3_9GLOM|nr:15254_t:CDS:2 [Acaulospora morrowiae]
MSRVPPAVPKKDLAPPLDTPYTPEELSKFDGRDGGSIYVAVKGIVFDVSDNRQAYGHGGSYHLFAGKDVSKGLGMGSLQPEHAVADYSTLNEEQLKTLDEWFQHFSNKYNKVGRVQ